jgi:hypothetical protein
MQPVQLHAITLEPLRTGGPDALQPNIPQILKIRLLEIEIVWEGTFRRVEVLKADDLFACAHAEGPFGALIPRTGRIVRAVFSVHFSDSPHAVTIQISASEPPDLPKGSDTEFVKRWLTQSGFCS